MKHFIKIFIITLPFSLFATELDVRLRKLLADQNISSIEFASDRSSAIYNLGEKLFSENLLSGNNNISCMTCHHTKMGSGDNLPLPIGEGGIGLGRNREMNGADIIARNSPHLFNLGLPNKNIMFWDGRVSYNQKLKTFKTPEVGLNGVHPLYPLYTAALTSALSAQAMFPPLSHSEMRGKKGSNDIADAQTNIEAWEKLTKRITSKQIYIELIKKSNPGLKISEVKFAHLAEAMANFQANKFTVTNTPFDTYLRGDNKALTQDAKKGAVLFFSKARCFMCHSGVNLTDEKFHNVAFPQVGPGKEESGDDKGLFLKSGKREDLYKFKTPSLRNIKLTGPYGHSGSLKTITKVLEHYNRPMRSNHHYEGDFSDLPYDLPVDWSNMNSRLRRIDPLIGRMGIPINTIDMKLIESFLVQGLSED